MPVKRRIQKPRVLTRLQQILEETRSKGCNPTHHVSFDEQKEHRKKETIIHWAHIIEVVSTSTFMFEQFFGAHETLIILSPCYCWRKLSGTIHACTMACPQEDNNVWFCKVQCDITVSMTAVIPWVTQVSCARGRAWAHISEESENGLWRKILVYWHQTIPLSMSKKISIGFLLIWINRQEKHQNRLLQVVKGESCIGAFKLLRRSIGKGLFVCSKEPKIPILKCELLRRSLGTSMNTSDVCLSCGKFFQTQK